MTFEIKNQEIFDKFVEIQKMKLEAQKLEEELDEKICELFSEKYPDRDDFVEIFHDDPEDVFEQIESENTIFVCFHVAAKYGDFFGEIKGN